MFFSLTFFFFLKSYYPGMSVDVPVKYNNFDDNPDLRKNAFFHREHNWVRVRVNREDVPLPSCVEVDLMGSCLLAT